MLSKKVLFIAEPIARDIAANPEYPGIAENCAPIVQALNDECQTTFAFTKENAIDELSDLCGGESQHHEEVAQISAVVANSVRNGMLQIQQYLKPFAVGLGKELSSYSGGYVSDYIQHLTGGLDFRFIELDNPIFKSDFYPTEVKIKSVAYDTVPVEDIVKTLSKFKPTTPEALMAMLGTQNDEIKALFREVSPYGIYKSLLDGKGSDLLYPLLCHGDTRFNFTRTFKLNLTEIFVAYVMLKRFSVDEQVYSMLENTTIAEFQNGLELLISCFESLLVTAKETYSIYTVREFTVLSTEATRLVQEGDIQVFAPQTIFIGTTASGVNKIEAAGVSTMEALIGYLLADRSKDLPAIAEEPIYYKSVYDQLVNRTRSQGDELAGEYVTRKCINEINKFQDKHPEINAAVIAINNNEPATRLSSTLVGAVEAFTAGFIKYVINGSSEVDEYVINSALISNLADACNLKIASRIITLATVTENCDLDVKGRRERLGSAVAQVIVEIYLGKLK